jgi:hypothetical protein
MDVADGYLHPDNFGQDRVRGNAFKDPLPELTPIQVRHALAIKAWQMLCQHLFKNTDKGKRDLPSWARMVTRQEVMQKIVWFFRSEKRLNDPNIRNLDTDGDGFYHETTKEFVSDFAQLAWTFRFFGEYSDDEDDKTVVQLKSIRPHLIEILGELGELDRLLNDKYETGDACLAKLKEMAMRKDIYITWEKPSFRKPTTVAEACWGGSKAAAILLTLETIRTEQKRLDAIRVARDEAAEAQRKLQKLTAATAS